MGSSVLKAAVIGAITESAMAVLVSRGGWVAMSRENLIEWSDTSVDEK
jgi:hypothetical protein